LVPLGISPEEPTDDDREQGREIRDGLPNRPVLLFVGRFRWYKGLAILLEAMDKVDATLLVVGSGSPSRERTLRRQAESLQHPDRVRFMGTVSRLEPLFVASDLFCLPSTHRVEAFGYVLLEAFRTGLPAVTTELGTGTSFVNLDGVTGYVVPPGDPKALAAGINQALSGPIPIESLGEAAKRRVSEEFDLEKMVDGIMAGYEEVLQA